MKELIIQLLKVLNENAGALNVLFTMFVAAATVAYAILTYSLVKETKKLREAQIQPKLSVTIKQREEGFHLIDMVIENIGAGPAYNIQFIVKSVFADPRGMLLSDMNIFRNGLSYLGPRECRQFFLANTLEKDFFEAKAANPLELDVTYFDALNKNYTGSFQIDLSSLKGPSHITPRPMTTSLAGIEDNTKHIADELQRLHPK
jgi:hypothetical protein